MTRFSPSNGACVTDTDNLSTPLYGTSTYTWTFGDGATSTLTNPVHAYTTPGIYTVTLTVDVTGETDTLMRTNYVTVSGGYTTISRTIHYIYDPLGRLTDAGYSTGESFEYAYDAAGNRQVFTSTTPLSGTLVTTYTFDAANRLTARSVSDGRSYTYTWSQRGQLLAETTLGVDVRTFAYDGAGQLVEATVFTLTTKFTYNGLGARTHVEVVGFGTTTVTLDYAGGNQILAETTITGTVQYLYGLDCLGELRDDEWLYYQHDGDRMVRQGTDADGEVVSTWLFDPDGTVLEGPEGPVSHLICGGVYDWSTGLIYKGGRYFAPNLGIWLALAPLAVVQSWRRKKRRGALCGLALALFLVGVSGMLTGCEEHHCVQKVASETLCTTVTPPPTSPVTPVPGDVVGTAKSFVGRFQWVQLDLPGGGNSDFCWCFKKGTEVDVGATKARMNCWEMVLLAGYEAGVIDQSTIYEEGGSQCLYCDDTQIVARVEEYLGYDDAILVYDGDRVDMLDDLLFVGGETIFFNNLGWDPGHVALAVGEGDKIVSLWNGPNGISSVQETTVREIMEWKGEKVTAVKVGYPRWWP